MATTPALPTQEDIARASKALGDAYAEVERLLWGLQACAREYDEYGRESIPRPPTYTDVALVFQLGDVVTGKAKQLSDAALEFGELTHRIDIARENAGLVAAGQ